MTMTMQVERQAEHYVIKIDDESRVEMIQIDGKWEILLSINRSFDVLETAKARALARALVMAADWAMERNSRE